MAPTNTDLPDDWFVDNDGQSSVLDVTKVAARCLWQPITAAQLVAEHPRLPFSPYYILGHDQHKWIRFGRYYLACRRWYYSGTNERSQWAQQIGGEPTHWMPMPVI